MLECGREGADFAEILLSTPGIRFRTIDPVVRLQLDRP